jgi:hypothetical protein
MSVQYYWRKASSQSTQQIALNEPDSGISSRRNQNDYLYINDKNTIWGSYMSSIENKLKFSGAGLALLGVAFFEMGYLTSSSGSWGAVVMNQMHITDYYIMMMTGLLGVALIVSGVLFFTWGLVNSRPTHEKGGGQ